MVRVMEGSKTKMTGWKITATTIFCKDIADEVTLIVTENGTITCTGMQRYFNNDRKRAGGKTQCLGESCPTMAEHKSIVLAGKLRSAR